MYKDGLSLILRCDCGNIGELKSENKGHTIHLMTSLLKQNFRIDDVDIGLDGDLENIEYLDEIDREINKIEIACSNCGNILVLEEIRV